MNPPAFVLRILVFALLIQAPSVATAQYMYLDSNGDGIHTSADVLHEVGPTVVDIWLDTGHNRDGTVPSCTANPTQPLDMFAYQVVMEATDGSLTFSSFTNRLSQFGVLSPSKVDGTHLDVGAYFAPLGISLLQGRYLLGTFTVNVASGTPSLRFLSTFSWPGPPNESYTGFGSHCDGTAYPNFITFDVNWFDADGLVFAAGGGGNRTPNLTPPLNMSVLSGESATQGLTATDADGQPLTFTKVSGPSFLFVYTADVGSGTASGEIRLAPFASDVGAYTASVSASDGAASDQASLQVNVTASPGHNPALLQHPRANVIAGRVVKRFLSAADPDGGTLRFAEVTGPRYAQVNNLFGRPGGASGVLSLSPTLCDVGSATVRLSVSDGVSQIIEDVPVEVLTPTDPPGSPLHMTHSTGDNWATQVADLNGDGKLDVIGTYEDRAKVTVFLGMGNGDLAAGVSYDIGSRAYDLTVGDFDRNGTIDVAVPDVQGYVDVLLGRGDGTLLPAHPYAVGHGSEQIEAGDVNRDGILDLVSANQDDNTVSVLLGAGDGTFLTRRNSATGTGPMAIAVADFNLDGRPDLALSHLSGPPNPELSILPGLGDGTFGDPIPTPFTGFAITIVSGDWNWDGKPDLALTDIRNRSVKTLIGQGDGSFAAPTIVANMPALYGITAEDLDQDGNTDLVTGSDGIDAVLFGNGSGGFGAPVSIGAVPHTYISMGDMNHDGRPDVVSSTFGDVFVRLNTFAPATLAAEARAFVPKEQKPIFAGSDNTTEIRLEPVHSSYANEQVDLSSVTLTSEGTGSVSEIHSIVPKSVVISDTDQNGIPDIGITFARSDLLALFDRLDRTKLVTAEVRGSILDGRAFCADVQLNVKKVGHSNGVAFAPNPLNPRSKLTFSTTRMGPAKAQLFDIQGRLIRTLLDIRALDAGDHEVAFDGRGARGTTLSSGVLFYRLTSVDGTFEGRLILLK